MWLAGLSRNVSSWLVSAVSAPKAALATLLWLLSSLSPQNRRKNCGWSFACHGRLGVGQLARLPLCSLSVESKQGFLITSCPLSVAWSSFPGLRERLHRSSKCREYEVSVFRNSKVASFVVNIRKSCWGPSKMAEQIKTSIALTPRMYMRSDIHKLSSYVCLYMHSGTCVPCQAAPPPPRAHPWK